MKRIHFLVRLYDLWIKKEESTTTRQESADKKEDTFFCLEMDFAKYKKHVFSHWKACQPLLWKETFNQTHPFFFHYRTDYAELLEPKQVRFHLFLSHQNIGSTFLSLHTLATGPEEYQLSMTLSPLTWTLGFKCRMYQDCVIQYRLNQLVGPILHFPFPIFSHPNFYWFEPTYSIEIWYISGERMTFCLKLTSQPLTSQSTDLHWSASPSFYLSDTTDMLEKATFFIPFYYNDRPIGYSLISLFQNFDPRSKTGLYRFDLPLHLYKSKTSVLFHLELQILHGPSFWPMRGGLLLEHSLVQGQSKAFFPQPNLIHHVHTKTKSMEKTLSLLDENQKELLRQYFQYGFSREWITTHLQELTQIV